MLGVSLRARWDAILVEVRKEMARMERTEVRGLDDSPIKVMKW